MKTQLSMKQKGFSLIELLIVLSIFAIIIGVATQRAQASRLEGSVTDQLTVAGAIYDKMQLSKKSPGYGTKDYADYIQKTDVLSASNYNVSISGSTATITNKYGGSVSVTGATNNFVYTETLIPAKVCTGLLTRLSSSQYSSVTIGGTSIAIPSAGLGGDVAATSCGSNPVTIAMTSNG